MPRGPQHPVAVRERILEAATTLFYRNGVHAVGVNEIAARASASKLSLYKHFPSKDELMAAMLAEHSDRIHAWLVRNTADAPVGADRALSVFDLLIEWFAQPGYQGCAVVNTVTDTRSAPRIAEIARRHLVRYRELLTDRLREVGVRDPAPLARQLLLLIEGASVVTTIDGDAAAGREARDAARDLIAARTA